MISLENFLQYCSAPLCYLSTFLYPFLSQSLHVSFIPFISSLFISLLPYQTLMCLCMPLFFTLSCVWKHWLQHIQPKMYWKPNPPKNVMDLVCILLQLLAVAGMSDTLLYNIAGLCYQLFLMWYHRINKFISSFLYLFLEGNLRDKLSTSKNRYK